MGDNEGVRALRATRGDFYVRRISRYLPLFALLLCSIQIAGAQSLIDLNMGFGSAQAKATGNGIEGDYTLGTNFGGPCTLGASVTCAKTNSLSGFMMGFGANLMLWQHFGVGMEATLEPGKPAYATIPPETVTLSGVLTPVQPAYKIQSRTTFYDFNGIYQPVNTKKATLQFIGGFGGANVKFYNNQSTSGLLGSSNYSSYLSSSNHFNLHAGVGVQIYINDHMYLRPEFDMHYVPNLNQFGTNIVKQEMIWVGYTIGDRQ